MEQNLSLYRIFHTVAKTGNISKASKELFISQPAISKSISRLESILDVPLFYRNSRGVVLTEEGSILFESTCVAFDSLELANQRISKIKSLGIGHIRIGASTTLCKFLLLPYLKAFVEQHPHIKITISCEATFKTVELLEENKLDIGLIGESKDNKDLDFFPIKEITDCFISNKSYIENLMVREEDASFSNLLAKGNLMLLDETNITRIFINDYFEKNDIVPDHVLEVSNMDLLIEFAKIGLGIACVIRNFVEDDIASGKLIELPLEAPIETRQVGFAFSTKYPVTDAMQQFIDFYHTWSGIEQCKNKGQNNEAPH